MFFCKKLIPLFCNLSSLPLSSLTTVITINPERKKFSLLQDPYQGPSLPSRAYALPVLPLVIKIPEKLGPQVEVNQRRLACLTVKRKPIADLPTAHSIDNRADEMTNCRRAVLNPRRTRSGCGNLYTR